MCTSYLIKLWTLRRYPIGWMIPMIFTPLLSFDNSKESRCGYVVLVMIFYWFTEVIPMAITAFIPLVMFPLFNILSSDEVTESYIDGSIMILLGSLIAACAVQKSNLHERLALRITLLTGTSPKRILLGFMFASAFLSMLVNGIASVALMIPIVNAAADIFIRPTAHRQQDIREDHKDDNDDDNDNSSKNTYNIDNGGDDENPTGNVILSIDSDQNKSNDSNSDAAYTDNSYHGEKDLESANKLPKAIFLSVCYAANIGSIGTLTGTPVNLVMNAFLKDDAISFSQWFFMNFPVVIVLILATWCFLSYFLIDSKNNSKDEIEKINLAMKDHYEQLGPLSFHEIAVLVLFALLVILWFFRSPDFMIGWAPLINDKPQYIKDSLPTMLVVILFFLIPANPSDIVNSPMLLDWKSAQQHVSWSIILLLGGGLAMARGCIESGLSQMLGDKLMVLDKLPHLVLMFIMCLAALSLTELISNTATCSILLPTSSVGMHPLSIVLPVTISCSFAFMFPFASGPTAIIYEASGMKNTDMIIPGIFVKFICLFGLMASHQLYWSKVFYNHQQFDNIIIN